MKFQLIVIISINFQIFNGQNCPALNCKQNSDNFFCLSSLTQKDCESDEYIVPYKNFCECCPGCQGGQPINEPCDSEPCAPGLICDTSGICVLDKSTCSYTYHLKNIKLLPTCEIDGKFAAVQCKGDRITGRCFCYSENGKRIFGWSWWKNAEDMTCACSRLKYNLEIQGGQNKNTLHCDQKGNFEQLQCTDGICWCANSTTGELWHNTRAVPESMWTFLPCYDLAKMGLKYLRQCESALNSQNLLRKALFAHGTTKMEFNNIKCDYDGAFGIYLNFNGITSCQWRDGTKLGSFQVASKSASNMNCNCGRDQKIFAESGLQHRLTCGGNGNYEQEQNINGKIFCVDSDGFAVNDAIETEISPNCSNYIYNEVYIPPVINDYKEYNEYKESNENEYNINDY